MNILRKRQRFTDHDDLALLREVLWQNPFENQDRWEIIAKHVFSNTGKLFYIRTLKDHLKRVIEVWLRQYKALKDKLGIQVTCSEKDNLCHDIYELMLEFKRSKQEKRKTNNGDNFGMDFRNDENILSDKQSSRATTSSGSLVTHDHEVLSAPQIPEFIIHEEKVIIDNLIDETNEVQNIEIELPLSQHCNTEVSSNVSGASRSRNRKNSLQRQKFFYLRKHNNQMLEIRRKELEFEKIKLTLEERKLTIEERKLAMEERKLAIEERKVDMSEREISLKEHNVKTEESLREEEIQKDREQTQTNCYI